MVLSLAMVAAVVTGCGNSGSTPASTDTAATNDTAATTDTATNDTAATTDTASNDAAADTSADSGELITVGIINNDPNESGYRTAMIKT